MADETELHLQYGSGEIGELSVIGRCPLERIHRISETAVLFNESIRNQAIARVLSEIHRKKIPEIGQRGYRTGKIALFEGDMDENGGYYAMIATKLRLLRERSRTETLMECVRRMLRRKPDVEQIREAVASYVHSLLLIDGLCTSRQDGIDWINELHQWSQQD